MTASARHLRLLGLVAVTGLVLVACEPDEDQEPEPEPEVTAPDDGTRPAEQDADQPDPQREPSPEPDDDPDTQDLDDVPGAETQTFEGPFFDTSTLAGTIGSTHEVAYVGDRSMEMTVESPGGFAFSRVQEAVRWEEGDEVVYGAAIYLEPGFNDAQGDGSVDILRWDNWDEQPEDADHGGLAILSDGRVGLISESQGNVPWSVLLGPFDMPEGEWVTFEVRQRLSSTDGEAHNEVWMNDRYLDENSAANYFGRPVTRFRVGIIGTPNPQPERLRLFVDRAAVAREGIRASD